MLCVVCGRNTHNNKNKKLKSDVSYFNFPKDPKLLKAWVKFCKQKDQLNKTSARICSDHFTSDDFDNNLQFELGLVSKKRIRLKPGSIPSVYKKTLKDDTFGRGLRIAARENKQIVQELLTASTNQMDTTEKEEFIQSSVKNTADQINTSSCSKCEHLMTQIDVIRLKMNTLEDKFNAYISNEIELKDKIKSLEWQLEQSKLSKVSNDQRLPISTEGHPQKLSPKDVKQQRCSKVDIAKSKTVYSKNSKMYKVLRKTDVALPPGGTLQRRAKMNTDLQPAATIMQIRSDLYEVRIKDEPLG